MKLTRRSLLLATPALWLPSRADAAKVLLFAKANPNPPYTAPAVAATRDDILGTPSLITGIYSGADSPYISMSTWLLADGSTDPGTLPLIINNDSFNNSGGFWFHGNNASFEFFGRDASSNSSQWDSDGSVLFPTSTWTNVLFNADFNHGAGLKIFNLYYGDTAVPGAWTDSNAAMNLQFNAASFIFNFVNNSSDAPGPNDVSDTWINVGGNLDFGIQANRRKFHGVDGKPISLGATGQLPTGSTPTFFFSGNSTGFLVNKGSGPAVTEVDGLWGNSPTSPSD